MLRQRKTTHDIEEMYSLSAVRLPMPILLQGGVTPFSKSLTALSH